MIPPIPLTQSHPRENLRYAFWTERDPRNPESDRLIIRVVIHRYTCSWHFTKAIVNSYSKQIADVVAASCLHDDPANLADPTTEGIRLNRPVQTPGGERGRERERERGMRWWGRKRERKDAEAHSSFPILSPRRFGPHWTRSRNSYHHVSQA